MLIAAQAAAASDPQRFLSEADMVGRFGDWLLQSSTPWGAVALTREWDYRNGFTDILARSSAGQLIAFEAKLHDWRRAAHQAYRNTVYAAEAYVVMPLQKAESASKHLPVFSGYGVGLCGFDGKCVKILIEAKPSKPLIPWLRESAEQFFDRGFHVQHAGLGEGRPRRLRKSESRASG